MKKTKLLLAICGISLLAAGCKKNTKPAPAPYEPTSSTQWTYDNKSFAGGPAQWLIDTGSVLGLLSALDYSGQNQLGAEFLIADPSARPAPGKYYVINPNSSNAPAGTSPAQFCIVVAGPLSNLVTSVGGTPADTAIVTYDDADKMIVYFSNITVTGGIKVTGTLVE